MRKTIAGMLAVWLVLIWGGGEALARGKRVTPAQKKEAKQHFVKGERHYKLGRFAKALEEYSAAYDALPLPGFLFNIGQCHRKLGNWERASFFYRGYLREKRNAPNRKVVEELLAESEKKLAAERAKAEKVKLADQQRLDEIRKREEAKRQRELEEKRAAEALALARAKAEAAEAARKAAEAEAAAKRAAPPPSTPVYKTWWFWTVLGVAVAGAATGASLYFTKKTVDPAGSLGTIDWSLVEF